MRLLTLIVILLGLSWSSLHAHCQKCKADGSELVKKARQVR
ncbi:MAG: hypothetical protein RLZZ112_1146 [Verrucomicrobiota bacterium]